MAKVEPVPCPRCGSRVEIHQSYGGRGCGDLTTYAAECDGCGMRQDHFGDNGRKDNATRGYNRWAAEETARLAGLPPPERTVKSKPVAVVQRPRSEFARGYFCAVSVLLREEGLVNASVRSLFTQGGDPAHADPLDIELFRELGLMA